MTKMKKKGVILLDEFICTIHTFPQYTKRDKNGNMYLPDDIDIPKAVRKEFEQYQKEQAKIPVATDKELDDFLNDASDFLENLKL